MKLKNSIKWLIFAFLSLIAATVCFLIYEKYKNSKNIKLSVILPVYNVSEYLPKCLDNLVNQTFSDFEMICVNDGSTDNSLDILKDYANKDKRIIIIDKENGGVSSARNTGIKASRGEYLTFFDPDDYFEDLDVYEICMEKIEKTNADTLIFEFINEPEKKQTVFLEDKIINDPFEAVKNQNINAGFVWNKIFRRSMIVDNNIWFKEDIKMAEDNLFVNMALTKSNITVTQPNVFYHYVYHPDSAGHKVSSERTLSDAVKRCEYLTEFYIENNYSEHYITVLDYCLCLITNYKTDDVQKNKFYTKKVLDVLDSKLLGKIENVPTHLNSIIENLRNFVNS